MCMRTALLFVLCGLLRVLEQDVFHGITCACMCVTASFSCHGFSLPRRTCHDGPGLQRLARSIYEDDVVSQLRNGVLII